MIFDIIKAIILGIVQGITEWLPISSTAHLILVQDILEFENVSASFFDTFKVVIQLGSIIAVIVLYFKKLFPYRKIEGAGFFKRMISDKEKWVLWIKIAIACVPAAVIGLLIDDIVDTVLSQNYVIAATLIVFGILFIYMERTKRKIKVTSLEKMTPKTAFYIGCFQTLALIPGTSRSGATIFGATMLGTSRPVAAEFSFFLAIPVMFGASFLKLVKHDGGFETFEVVLMLIGSLTAFIVSVLAIKTFMNYIRKHSFEVFGWYRILLGIIIIVVTAVQAIA